MGWLPDKKQLRHLPKVLSRKERYLIMALSLIAIGALVAIPIGVYRHFTKPAPAYGGEFSEGLIGAPKFVNPLLAQTNDVDRDLSALVYVGLMKYDSNGKLAPALSESYNVSDDGLTYTFKLRDGLRWHDGQPITADDVVFTILTTQNSDYGSFQRINWQGVDVSKTDDQTIVFKLKNKYAQFLANTTLGILPKHIWETAKPSAFSLSEFNLKPVGSGPYKFAKIRRDTAGNVQNFELVAFDKYYDGKPYIKHITFKFYDSEDALINAYNGNRVDNLGFISAQKLNSIRFPGQLNTYRLKLPRYFAIFLNQNKSSELSDKNVRAALAYATDKQAILGDVLNNNGLAVDSPMLPGILDLPDAITKYEHDPDKAKQILDKNGWPYSEQDGLREKPAAIPKATPKPKRKSDSSPTPAPSPQPTKLEIQLTTSNWPELVAVAGKIKKQWEALGIHVNLRILPWPELQQAIKDRDYEALLFGELLGLDPDPFSFWHSSQKRDPGLNLALYDNKSADKLLEEARQTMDSSARLSKYDDFQKIVVNDIPAIFLYSPYYLYAQTKQIKGNDSSTISMPADRFTNINKWYINTTRVRK